MRGRVAAYRLTVSLVRGPQQRRDRCASQPDEAGRQGTAAPPARYRSVRARATRLGRKRKPLWRGTTPMSPTSDATPFTSSPEVWSVVSADRHRTPRHQGLGWRNAGQVRCRCLVGTIDRDARIQGCMQVPVSGLSVSMAGTTGLRSCLFMPTLSCKYRIEPNKAQAASLSDMLADFFRLYNAGLQQRIEAWQQQGKSIG
jgi:hypothetical protein